MVISIDLKFDPFKQKSSPSLKYLTGRKFKLGANLKNKLYMDDTDYSYETGQKYRLIIGVFSI